MKFCRIIIKSVNDTVKFRAFAMDPSSGYLFLTKYDPKSRMGAEILRCSMDGEHMISLLSEKLFYPNDLTLDVAVKKIYFLDHYFDFIQQCNYDGSNRQFLQKLPLMKFHRIAFFENTFYGAANKNLSVVQVSKSTKFFKKILALEDSELHPKMLRIFHQQIQPMTARSNICPASNKCEHLCVPVLELANSSTPRVVEKCLCREGFKLENGKCKLYESRKFLLYVEDNPKMLKAVDIDEYEQQVMAPIVGLQSNIAFDVDLVNKKIFFTSYVPTFTNANNSGTNSIEFQSFDGSDRGIIRGDFGEVQTIAYDWVGKNLYFTSKTPKPKIAACRIKTDKQFTIVRTLINKNLIGPCSLALDPEKGELISLISRFLNIYSESTQD